jgi:hypothetical protein
MKRRPCVRAEVHQQAQLSVLLQSGVADSVGWSLRHVAACWITAGIHQRPAHAGGALPRHRRRRDSDSMAPARLGRSLSPMSQCHNRSER